MARPSANPGQEPSAVRRWATFVLLTIVLTLAGLALIRLVRPSALRGLFSSQKEGMIKHGQASFLVKHFGDALFLYAHEHAGQCPAKLEELLGPGADGKPYLGELRAIPLDPWNRPFHYEPATSANPKARVYSLGADGQAGGVGENADIESD